MPTPPKNTPTIAERILDNCIATVLSINTNNGYDIGFTAPVHDQPFNAMFDERLPSVGVVLTQEDPAEEGTVQKHERLLRVQIDFWLKRDVERMIGAIIFAMLDDPARGGHAIDTTLGSVARAEHEKDEREAGGVILFDVHYRFARAQPTVQG